MNRDKLTERQEEVLRHIAKCEFPPTYREIADGMGFKSTNAVSQHIDKLRLTGYLDREVTGPRSVRLTQKAKILVSESPLETATAQGPTPQNLRRLASTYRESANQLEAIAENLEQEMKNATRQ